MISFALVERQSQLCLFEFLYRTYSQGMTVMVFDVTSLLLLESKVPCKC